MIIFAPPAGLNSNFKNRRNKNLLSELIPEEWKPCLKTVTEKESFQNLSDFIEKEYQNNTIYPEKKNIFNAIRFVKPQDVKVVILGQDPYHEPNQAHGLSFSVKDGTPPPKSLINIYKEMKNDIGCDIPKTGCLENWAKQGVLLLNTVLTVREHDANSHKGKGWEIITSEIIKTVLENPQPKVFILWGKQALDTFYSVYNKNIHKNVYFLSSAHPSPLSANRGFFGSKPFSKTNAYFKKHGVEPIEWDNL